VRMALSLWITFASWKDSWLFKHSFSITPMVPITWGQRRQIFASHREDYAPKAPSCRRAPMTGVDSTPRATLRRASERTF